MTLITIPIAYSGLKKEKVTGISAFYLAELLQIKFKKDGPTLSDSGKKDFEKQICQYYKMAVDFGALPMDKYKTIGCP